MKVYEISMGVGTNPFTECTLEKAAEGVRLALESSEVGTVVSVKIKQMGEAEYAALPEWTGP